jgi:hypothetical protein
LYLEAALNKHLPRVPKKHKKYLQPILTAVSSANLFMRTLYHADLWLADDERDTLISACNGALTAYQECANIAFACNRTRFKLQPKFHLIGEVSFALQRERLHNLPSLNPLASSTQLDEDFIGRVAAHSRQVSGKTMHVRTLRKYMVALGSLW